MPESVSLSFWKNLERILEKIETKGTMKSVNHYNQFCKWSSPNDNNEQI